jgi:CheY-like chemotaxis protein
VTQGGYHSGVGRLPTIVVAGGGDLYVKLLEPFPPTLCNIAFAESLAEALDVASDACLVVVDSKLSGGGVDLCRRLRSDPVTSTVPLILRVPNRGDHVQALSDARVLENDLPTLVKTMRQLSPELSGRREIPELSEDSPDENYFDDGPTTVAFRRPEAAPGKAGEWPQPPPARGPRQDLLEFAQIFAGYMNSLIEAMEAPSKLSAEELERLRGMVTLTVEGTEQHLTSAQTAITEALVKKDLERMKALSSAKNSLYDKLQQMRSMVSKLPRSEGPGGAVKTVSGPIALGAPKKSELTRAAEAKAAAEKTAAAADKKAERDDKREKRDKKKGPVKPAAYRSTKSARREGERSSLPYLLAAALLVAAVGVGVYLLFFQEPSTTAPVEDGTNQPPTMKYVRVEQTTAGVVARAEGDDKEQDPVIFQFRWLVNGKEVEGQKTARLTPQHYHEGDTVALEVTPSDGKKSGTPLTSAGIIIRSTPLPPTPPAPPAPPSGGTQPR